MMDKKYLAEIKTRAQEAKAEKQKGNDFDCACLSWAIVLNDLPALLAEVEQEERDKAAQYMEIVRLREQIATLEEALEARLIELKASCNGDSAETYTTGYRNGHRNGQIELIEWALKKPSKSVCQAQQTHETQEAEK